MGGSAKRKVKRKEVGVHSRTSVTSEVKIKGKHMINNLKNEFDDCNLGTI